MKHNRTPWKIMILVFVLLVAVALLAPEDNVNPSGNDMITASTESLVVEDTVEIDTTHVDTTEDAVITDTTEADSTEAITSEETEVELYLDTEDIPPYTGAPVVEMNGDIPLFTQAELLQGTTSFEQYSDLDALGRCGVAFASVGPDLLPIEERGEIGFIKPSGWHTVKYNGIIDGNYLYNRCHLIAYCLAGENANELNLITGTRYLNVEGMLLYEEMVVRYVERTGNHVLYRVTPVFEGDNLVCNGVLMEGYSVEDEGAGICFHVYAYNVQPYIWIDYATGDSHLEEGVTTETDTEDDTEYMTEVTTEDTTEELTEDATIEEKILYVLNMNTKKFHYPWCHSVDDMSPKNRKDVNEDRDTIIGWGYVPCKICEP